MKYIKSKFFLTLLFLFLGLVTCLAAPPLPEPGDDENPGHPDMPIDQNLYILLIIALLYGAYILYRHKLNKKRQYN
jgi:hypothetical protein